MMRLEATYIVKDLPAEVKKSKHEEIEQGYLVDAPDASRIRKKGTDYTITRKMIPMEGDLSYRDYVTLPLLKEEFDKLWKITTRRLKKTRYYYLAGEDGMELRVDVFGGDLKGLVLAELIFPDETAKRDFALPSWFGTEVTNEAEMSNQSLAGKEYSQVKAFLEKKGQ